MRVALPALTPASFNFTLGLGDFSRFNVGKTSGVTGAWPVSANNDERENELALLGGCYEGSECCGEV